MLAAAAIFSWDSAWVRKAGMGAVCVAQAVTAPSTGTVTNFLMNLSMSILRPLSVCF